MKHVTAKVGDRDAIGRILRCAHPPVSTSATPPMRGLLAAWVLRCRWTRRAALALLPLLPGNVSRSALDAAARIATDQYFARDRSVWERWLIGSDPARIELAEALAVLNDPNKALAAFGGVQPGDLVVIGPGVDPVVIDRLVWPTQGAHALDLSLHRRQRARRPLLGGQADLLARAVVEDWFEDARAMAEIAADEIVAGFEDARLKELARAARPLLGILLKHAIAPQLRAAAALETICRERRPARVVILEERAPVDALCEAAQAGVGPDLPVFVACIGGPTTRRRRRARDANEGLEVPADPAAHEREFAATVAAKRPLRAFGSWRGANVISVDLRHPKDFRHHQVSLDILAEAPGPVVTLQTWGRLDQRHAHAFWLSLRQGARRFALLRDPSASPARGPIPRSWRTATLACIEKAFEGKVSFAPSRRAAALEAIGAALVHAVPSTMAGIRDVALKLRENQCAGVIAVPSGKVTQAILISAARHVGTPSLDVITLLLGTSARDNPPLADQVAVIDESQRRLIVDRFGLDPSRVTAVGRQDLDVPARMDAGARVCFDSPWTVRYFSQPLGELAYETLDALVDIAQSPQWREKVRLFVHPHPDESPQTRARFSERIARAGGVAVLEQKPHSDADIAGADLIVTMASNVGLKAVAMGRPLVVIDLSEKGLPIRFDRDGIALGAHSREEIAVAFAALLSDPTGRAALAARQRAFLDANPALAEPGYARRVCAALDAARAARRAQSDTAANRPD
jgi:hypothetical protein